MELRLNFKTWPLLVMISMTVVLSACSGSSPNKQNSIWDQRRNSSNVSAPEATEYKKQLAAVEQDTFNVEQSYLADPIETIAPETAAEVIDNEVEEIASTANSVDREILAMPITHYTVQLFATVDIDRVYKFAEQNQISTRYVVPTARDGIIWYVLLLDVYPDYATAKAAMQDISPSLKTQPWVRSIGSLQKFMQ